jgi:hypothetical protein
LVGDNYRVLNFGFHGYGSHQMLAALEHGIVDDALAGSVPRIVVYQAMHYHVWRSAGLAPWDTAGPRYLLDDNGTPRHAGSFADQYQPWIGIRKRLMNSSIGVRLVDQHWLPPITRGHVRLYVALIKRSKQVLEKRYPGVAFHVILWDWEDETRLTNAIKEELAAGGIAPHLISEVLPEFHADPGKYEIPVDRHPNSLAHRVMAQYIYDQIIPHKPTTDQTDSSGWDN